MKVTLQSLQELQQTNRKLEQLARDKERLSIDVKNQQRLLEQKKRRAEATHKEHMDASKAADRAQLQIEAAEQDNQRLQLQLNTVSNQREYDAIQTAILSNQADIHKWEDEALASLERVDELSAQGQRLAAEIEAASKELEQVKREVARKEEDYNQQISKISSERRQIRENIRPEVLQAYDRLARAVWGWLLATVRNRICGGCHTRITKQSENLLMRGADLVYCHSCGRLLMLAEQAS